MKLDLDRQESGRSGLSTDEVVELGWAEDRPARAAVNGELQVDNLENRFILSGILVASGRAECSRCLADFDLAWDVPVECMVLRDVHSREGEGDSMVLHQRCGEVDLLEVVRECVILAFPQAPVCRDECRGLCPHCGADLNKKECDCAEQDVDPRWEGLP